MYFDAQNRAVVMLNMDDDIGFIYKTREVIAAEYLPVGVSIKNGIPDLEQLNQWW